MADSLVFNASLFADAAKDFAVDNADTIYSEFLAPGEEGIPNSPIRPLGEYVRPLLTRDEVLLTQFIIGDVLQPDKRAGFTASTDKLEFRPRTQKVKPGKINLKFTEADIVAFQKTWYGMQQGRKGSVGVGEGMIFEEYMFMQVLKKAKSSLRNTTLWLGDYDPDTANAVSICDGLRKIIDDMITATDIPAGHIADTATISASNAVTELQKILDVISAENIYRDDLICLISPAQYTMYCKHYQSSRGSIVYNSQYAQGVIEGSLIPFFVEPGMNGYNPVITSRGNIAWIYDNDFTSFAPQVIHMPIDEYVAFILKFQIAFDIINPKEVWTGV
jgi:hypothetical protein